MALDTYYRGHGEELEFCKKIKAGGNHLVATTAAGRILAAGESLRLRERDLSKVVDEFKKLPDAERKPALPPDEAPPQGKKVLPKPPPGGLVVRGYCAYLSRDEQGRVAKAKEYYYKENPDRWAAETQSDMLWLTEAEWKSLLPADPKKGDTVRVSPLIQRRLYSTIGIDYMEGSVNSLVPRETTMTLTVESASPERVTLRLEGDGKLGKEFDEKLRSEKNSRGSHVRILGFVGYDVQKKRFDRFDLVGLGLAWGNKMDYVRREVRLGGYPWMYGIACELVTGDAPMDLIPPYNLLHYNSVGKYFD